MPSSKRSIRRLGHCRKRALRCAGSRHTTPIYRISGANYEARAGEDETSAESIRSLLNGGKEASARG